MTRRRITRQRGTILVLAAAGAVVLLGATALSIDVGYFFYVKNQLQNAVDAAALAGAQGLMSQPGNYTSSGAAQKMAVQLAAANQAAAQAVQLQSSEITFPKANIIKIDITRPARTFFAAVVGMNTVNIRVKAAAAVVGVNGGGGPGGWRPFAPMDQFGHGPFCVSPNDDTLAKPHGPYNAAPHLWNGLTVADHYKAPYDDTGVPLSDLSSYTDCGDVTGFITSRDVMLDNGTVTLKTGDWQTPGNFGPVDFGAAGGGANDYKDAIINGWSGELHIGDIVFTETGNMVGPTAQGCSDLIAQDPGATVTKDSVSHMWTVTGSKFDVSPRLVPIVMYSPLNAPVNGKNSFPISNMGAFFIKSCRGGKELTGTFMAMVLHGGQGGSVVNVGSRSSGAGGLLLGTTVLVNPDSY